MADWTPPDKPLKAWTPPDAPVQQDRPDTRGKARLPDDSNLSVLDRLWRGLSGNDVTVPGQIAKGMANPFYKGAQIGALMMEMPGGGVPEQAMAPQPGPEAAQRTQQVDTAVQQREERYTGQRKAAGQDTEGFFSNIWEKVGEIASPVTLAAGGAAGKAMGAAGSTAGRIALGAAGGAALAPMTSPVTDTKNFGKEVAKEAVGGAVGGALGAAAGEAVTGLAKALAGNTPTEVETMLTRGYRRAVKPSIAGPQSFPRIQKADRDIVGVFDEIADNKAALKYADPITGETSVGQAPNNMAKFASAIFQRKGAIWDEISDKIAKAGDKGAIVDLKPMSERLLKAADKVELADPHAADAILMDAARYEARGSVTPKEAEQLLEVFNQETSAWWKNPNSVTSHRVHALVEAASSLRETLDDSISKLEGPGFQALKTRYGRLKAVEDAVAKAALRDQKNLPAGLVGELLQAGGVTDLLHGLIDPTKLPRAGAMLAARMWLKKLRDPNAAIARLFRLREQPLASGAGLAMVQGARSALPPAGGLAGGLAGGAAARNLTRNRARREEVTAPAGMR